MAKVSAGMRMPVREKSPRPRLAGSRIPLCLAALPLLWTVTSCTASAKPTPHASTATSPTATTSSSALDPTSPVRSAVISAYDAMWTDMTAAAKTANYQDPVLAQHASGAALSTLVRGLYSYQRQGWVVRGTPITHPKVTELSPSQDPSKATVTDCLDDTHWLVQMASGQPVQGAGGGHRRVTAIVQNAGGVWKVTQLDALADGSC